MSVATTVIKRDGRSVEFDRSRIFNAIGNAYQEVHGQTNFDFLDHVTDRVESVVLQQPLVSVEEIQNQVEKALAAIDFDVARRYIIYREQRSHVRGLPLDQPNIQHRLSLAIDDIAQEIPFISKEVINQEASILLTDQSSDDELNKVLIMVSRSLIEREPEYSNFAANALLRTLYHEVYGTPYLSDMKNSVYRDAFVDMLHRGIRFDRYDERLISFDLNRLAIALVPERDYLFKYLGLQTLYDRYFTHINGQRIELPQAFWMRVAMGLALAEKPEEQTDRAIEFYDMLSTFRLCSSTPTLFNAGTKHPQLSSCYLSTVEDDLASIFKLYADNAQLSKWAGGLGIDMTPIRSLGSHIKTVNGKSSGTIPFIKIMNDTVAGVSQAGKRRGSGAVYMEIWHADFEEFLDLRKNTGDERRRAHDLNTAAWIPDLFMERVEEDGLWTLLSPSDAPELHETYGESFREHYEHYEALVESGVIQGKRVSAVNLWRQLLGSLFETGHPWITFKDPSNIRNNQQHVGVVHSSNLCTEILLNTSKDEIAVCNLLSINLANHINQFGLDQDKLYETIETGIRMLDNVIDINFYPVPEARNSNLKHRPIGLGIMGFQDALWQLGISYASHNAVEFADESMEFISYWAITHSALLAQERGAYESYEGSLWSQGLLPMDTWGMMEQSRGRDTGINFTWKNLDWEYPRQVIQKYGMRNSNVMAIAPTATIANIQGVTQSIEPMFSNMFVKSNLSGDFTVVNEYLVHDLRELGLWNKDMLSKIKYYDGSIQDIEEIPTEIRVKYPNVFEMDAEWLIEAAARRQKWIDMGQSLNLYIAAPSGKRLHDLYFLAWERGLKTTYYLRSRGATTVEKSTLDVNKFGVVPRWMKNKSASADIVINREELSVENEDEFGCEACS